MIKKTLKQVRNAAERLGVKDYFEVRVMPMLLASRARLERSPQLRTSQSRSWTSRWTGCPTKM